MAIHHEFISVAIPISKVEHVYPGGFEGYMLDYPHGLWDEHLVVIPTMSPKDAELTVREWAELGLRPMVGQESGEASWLDLCVCALGGPTLPCEWIAYGRIGYMDAVWLKGTEPGEVVSWYRDDGPT